MKIFNSVASMCICWFSFWKRVSRENLMTFKVTHVTSYGSGCLKNEPVIVKLVTNGSLSVFINICVASVLKWKNIPIPGILFRFPCQGMSQHPTLPKVHAIFGSESTSHTCKCVCHFWEWVNIPKVYGQLNKVLPGHLLKKISVFWLNHFLSECMPCT